MTGVKFHTGQTCFDMLIDWDKTWLVDRVYCKPYELQLPHNGLSYCLHVYVFLAVQEKDEALVRAKAEWREQMVRENAAMLEKALQESQKSWELRCVCVCVCVWVGVGVYVCASGVGWLQL